MTLDNRKKVNNELSDNTMVDDESTYKIINYFGGHNSLMVTVLSAIIAIVSFILNMSVYLYINSYLNYWDSINMIEIKTINLFYTIIIVFLYTIVFLSTSMIISNTYDAYYAHQKMNNYSKYMEKIAKKQIKKAKKVDFPEKDELIDNTEKLIESSRVLRKKTDKNERSYIWLSIVACFLIIFVFTIPLCLVLLTNEHAIIISCIIALCQITVNVLINILFNYVRLKIAVKREFRLDKETINKLRNTFREYPIENFIYKKSSFLKDANIIKSILVIMMSLLIVMSASVSLGNKSAEKQKEFYVIADEESCYVVIYNNGQDMLLKKAVISGDTVEIDMTEQKVISINNIKQKKYIFEHVKIKNQ